MKLYDSPFSPFARKVRMVLELKGLVFDGLDKDNHDGLARVNPRLEGRRSKTTAWQWSTLPISLPTLEHRYPDQPVYPADPGARVRARARGSGWRIR